MSIDLGEVTAKCNDCKEQFRGRLVLNVWDFAMLTDVGVISGELLSTLCSHHDENRKWGGDYRAGPQHSEFKVSQGGRYLGELGPVSSFGSEIKFIVRDPAIRQQFYDEIRGYQRSRGYHW